jgi:tape measure domain-containing protein
MAVDVKLEIGLITTAFTKALDDAKKSSQEFSNTFDKQVKKNSNTFDVFTGIIASNVVVGAFQGMTRAVKSFVEASADMESAKQRLENLTGSAELTADLYKKLVDFAAKTPFEMSGITEATAQLLNFGSSSQDIPKLLDAIGNIAANANKPIQDIAIIFGQVQAAGKLTGERLLQLQEQGVPALKLLGESMGKTELAVKQMVTDGKVGFDKFRDAVVNFSKEGQPAFGAMEKQSKTLNGMFSTLGDSIKVMGAGFGDSLMPLMKDAVQGFTDLADTVLKNKQVILDVGKAFVLASTTMAAILGVQALVALGFTGIAAAAGTAWATITGPIGIIVGSIALLTAGLYQVYKHFDDIKSAAYNALAASLEFLAKGASLFSADKAKALLDQAAAYREQAKSITPVIESINNEKLAHDQLEETKKVNHKAQLERQQRALDDEKKFQQGIFDAKRAAAIAEEELRITKEANDLKLRDAKFAKLIEDLGLEAAIKVEAEANVNAMMEPIENDAIKRKIEKAKFELDLTKQTAEARTKKLQEQQKIQREDNDSYWAYLFNTHQAGNKKLLDWDQMTNRQKVENQKSSLDQIATLTTSTNKELFFIGKAAAVAKATIDGISAVQTALASAPPPFNFAIAGLVGVAAAANVAKIASQQPPAFENGGIVGGTSYTGDRVAARVNSGEMILNKSQQANLFNQINNPQSSVDERVVNLLATIADGIKSNMVIQIDGREIVNVVRDGLVSGRQLA